MPTFVEFVLLAATGAAMLSGWLLRSGWHVAVAALLVWVAIIAVMWPALLEHGGWFASLLIFLLVAAFAPKAVRFVARGRREQ